MFDISTNAKQMGWLVCAIALSGCSQQFGLEKVFDVSHSIVSTDPNSKTALEVSIAQTYKYNTTCTVQLEHNCWLETKLAVGGAVKAYCVIKSSDVAAASCLSELVKSRLSGEGAFSIILLRESSTYRLLVTLTEGHLETYPNLTLANILSLSKASTFKLGDI